MQWCTNFIKESLELTLSILFYVLEEIIYNFSYSFTDKKMSGKVKQRTSANPTDSSTLSVNEKILRECHNLYSDPDNGNFFCFFLLIIDY